MTYFTKDTFQFLRDLGRHNNKEWLDENRTRYKEHREKVIEFAGALYDSFATVDTMPLQDPKKSVARINNNRKFHPEKPPYKSNFAVMVNRGEGRCGFYVHIEPENNFVGGGIYHPPREKLNAVRNLIDREGQRLEDIRQSDEFKRTFGDIRGDELKTSPQDFPQDHSYIHLIRKKDFTVMYPIKNQDFIKGDIVARITDIYQKALSFLNFIDDALPAQNH